MNSKNKTVYVGLSGGVDSSVSAALLKEAGYQVVGVFIDVWQPEFLNCTSKDDRRDAMRVCAQLGIPFKRLDCRTQYKQMVVDYMISEYRSGRTPNPDIMCNRYVKFGVFLERALAEGADYVATGHYARIDRRPNSRHLMEGVDKEKDQSYFLWTLTENDLSHLIFPLGDLKKDDVRAEASRRKLVTAHKRDSQGICFLGKVDLKDFLGHYIPHRRGAVVDICGRTIGFHDGAWLYTRGQRHGFTVERKGPDDGPFYVADRQVDRNTITVSQKKDEGTGGIRSAGLVNTNWITEAPGSSLDCSCRVRYRQPKQPCTVICDSSGVYRVQFEEPQSMLSEGQSVVFYSGEDCLGGGILDTLYRESVLDE